MARILIDLGYQWHTYYGFSGTAQRDYFEDVRNRFRSALDPLGTHVDVLVTDIVRWVPSGNYAGYYFLIKAMSGGVPTGPVWAINCCTGENGQVDGDWRNVYWWYGTNGIDNYYETWYDNNLYAAYNSTLSYFYHPTAGKGLVSFTGTSSGSPGIGTTCVDNLIIPTKQGTIEDVQDAGTTWIVKMDHGETFYDTDTLFAGGQNLTSLTANYSHCFNFGFTDHDNGLLGGTISAPVTEDYPLSPYNPKTSEATFKKFFIWPYDDMLRGNVDFQSTDFNTPFLNVVVYDTDKPFLASYASYNQSPSIYTAYFSGNIITPYATEDTFGHATFWTRFDPSDVDNPGDVLNWRMWGQTPTGGRTTYSRARLNFLGYDNSPRYEDWKFGWHPVPIYNSSYIKGELDTDIFRIMGKTSDSIYRLFDGPDGPFIKYSAYLVYPWVTGEPTFPPVNWANAYPWKD